MKLGVLTILFGARPFEETLDYLKSVGAEAVELGSRAYVQSSHCPTEELLNDDVKIETLKNAVAVRNLTISALSCHGNPVHPALASPESTMRILSTPAS
jgi:sugar phosphate isomerase/epimerase